jgi:hypothetical protein
LPPVVERKAFRALVTLVVEEPHEDPKRYTSPLDHLGVYVEWIKPEAMASGR